MVRFIASVIAIALAVLALYAILLRSGRDIIAAAEQSEVLKQKTKEGFKLGEGEEIDLIGYDANRFGTEITIHGPPAPKPDFTFKMKIALGFAQITTNLAIGLEIQWPTAFKEFMSWLTPANLDFVQVSSIGCVVNPNYYEKLFYLCLIPAVLEVLIVVGYLIPLYVRYATNAVKRKIVRRKFWKLALFTLFLVYPSVSSSIMRFFVCREIDGVSYLQADFNQRCNSDDWNRWQPFAAAMVLVFPVGIPVFFFFMLARYRKRLDEIGVRAELGFLYDAYTRDAWWFEMIDMTHKLIVTSLLGFLPYETQMPVGMGIVVLYMVIILGSKPYLRKSDDRLHLFAQTEIILLLMSGNIFNRLTSPDELMDVVLSICLIGIVLAFFAFFLLQAVQAVIKMCSKDKEKRPTGERLSELDGRPIEVEQAKVSPQEQAKMGSLDVEMAAVDRRLLRSTRVGVAAVAAGTADAGSTVEVRRNPMWDQMQGSFKKEKPEPNRARIDKLFEEAKKPSEGDEMGSVLNSLSQGGSVNAPLLVPTNAVPEAQQIQLINQQAAAAEAQARQAQVGHGEGQAPAGQEPGQAQPQPPMAPPLMMSAPSPGESEPGLGNPLAPPPP